jgi:hypothetical protein
MPDGRKLRESGLFGAGSGSLGARNRTKEYLVVDFGFIIFLIVGLVPLFFVGDSISRAFYENASALQDYGCGAVFGLISLFMFWVIGEVFFDLQFPDDPIGSGYFALAVWTASMSYGAGRIAFTAFDPDNETGEKVKTILALPLGAIACVLIASVLSIVFRLINSMQP